MKRVNKSIYAVKAATEVKLRIVEGLAGAIDKLSDNLTIAILQTADDLVEIDKIIEGRSKPKKRRKGKSPYKSMYKLWK